MILTTNITSVREFSLYLQAPAVNTVHTGLIKFNEQLLTLFLYRFYQNPKLKKNSDQTTELLLNYFIQNPKLPEIISLCIKYTQEPSSNDDKTNNQLDGEINRLTGSNNDAFKMKKKGGNDQTTPDSGIKSGQTSVLNGGTYVNSNQWVSYDMSFFLISMLLLYFDDELFPKPSNVISTIAQSRSTLLHITLDSYIGILTDLLQFATWKQSQYDTERYKDPSILLPISPFVHAMASLSFILTIARSNIDNCESIMKKIDFSRRTILFWLYRVYDTRKPRITQQKHDIDDFDDDNDVQQQQNGKNNKGNETKSLTNQTNLDQSNSLNDQSLQLYGLQTRTLLISFMTTIISYHNSQLNTLFFSSKNSHFIDLIFQHIHLDPIGISKNLLKSIQDHIFDQLSTGNFRLYTLLSFFPTNTNRPISPSLTTESHIDFILKIAQLAPEDSNVQAIVNNFLFSFVTALLPSIKHTTTRPMISITNTDYQTFQRYNPGISLKSTKNLSLNLSTSTFDISTEQLIKFITRFTIKYYHSNYSSQQQQQQHQQIGCQIFPQSIPLSTIITPSKWETGSNRAGIGLSGIHYHSNSLIIGSNNNNWLDVSGTEDDFKFTPITPIDQTLNAENDDNNDTTLITGDDDVDKDDSDDDDENNDENNADDNEDDGITKRFSISLKSKLVLRSLRAIFFIMRKLDIQTETINTKINLNFILSIIHKCPMLYIPYIQTLTFPLKFHSPIKWMNTMFALQQLLAISQPEYFSFQLPLSASSSQQRQQQPNMAYYLATITTVSDHDLFTQTYKGIAILPQNQHQNISSQLMPTPIIAPTLNYQQTPQQNQTQVQAHMNTVQACPTSQQHIITSLLLPVHITKSTLSQWILESNIDDKMIIGIDSINKTLLANSQLEVKNIALGFTIQLIQRYTQLIQSHFDHSTVIPPPTTTANVTERPSQPYTATVTTQHPSSVLPLIPVPTVIHVPNTTNITTTSPLAQTLHGYRYYCPTTHLLFKQILPELPHLVELFSSLLPFATGGHYSTLSGHFSKANKIAVTKAVATSNKGGSSNNPQQNLMTFNYLYTIATQPRQKIGQEGLINDDDHDSTISSSSSLPSLLSSGHLTTNFSLTTSISGTDPSSSSSLTSRNQSHRPSLITDILTQILTLFRLFNDIFPDYITEYKFDMAKLLIKPSLLFLPPKTILAALSIIQPTIDTSLSIGNALMFFKLPPMFTSNLHYERLMSHQLLSTTPTSPNNKTTLPPQQSVSSLGPFTMFGALLHLLFTSISHSTKSTISKISSNSVYYGITKLIPQRLWSQIDDIFFVYLLQNILQITISPDHLADIAANCTLSVVNGDKLTLFDDSAPYSSLRVRIINEGRDEQGDCKTIPSSTVASSGGLNQLSPQVISALSDLIPNQPNDSDEYTTVIWDKKMLGDAVSKADQISRFKQIMMSHLTQLEVENNSRSHKDIVEQYLIDQAIGDSDNDDDDNEMSDCENLHHSQKLSSQSTHILTTSTNSALTRVIEATNVLIYRLLISSKPFITTFTHLSPSTQFINTHNITLPTMITSPHVTSLQHNELSLFLYYLTPQTIDFFELIASKTFVSSVGAKVSTLLSTYFTPKSVYDADIIPLQANTVRFTYTNPLNLIIDDSMYFWLLSRVSFTPLIITALWALLLLGPGRRRGWCTQYVSQIIWSSLQEAKSIATINNVVENNNDDEKKPNYMSISDLAQVQLANVIITYLILTSEKQTHTSMDDGETTSSNQPKDLNFSTSWLSQDPFIRTLIANCTQIIISNADNGMFNQKNDKSTSVSADKNSSKRKKQSIKEKDITTTPSHPLIQITNRDELTAEHRRIKTSLLNFFDLEKASSESESDSDINDDDDNQDSFDDGYLMKLINGTKQLNSSLKPLATVLTMLTPDDRFNPFSSEDIQSVLIKFEQQATASSSTQTTQNSKKQSKSIAFTEQDQAYFDLLNHLPLSYIITQVSTYIHLNSTTLSTSTINALCHFLKICIYSSSSSLPKTNTNDAQPDYQEDLPQHAQLLIESQNYTVTPSRFLTKTNVFSSSPSLLAENNLVFSSSTSLSEHPTHTLCTLLQIHNVMILDLTPDSVCLPLFETLYITILSLISNIKNQYPHTISTTTGKLLIPSASPVPLLVDQILTSKPILTNFTNLSSPVTLLLTRFVITVLQIAFSPSIPIHTNSINSSSSSSSSSQEQQLFTFDGTKSTYPPQLAYPTSSLNKRDRLIQDSIAICDTFPLRVEQYLTTLLNSISNCQPSTSASTSKTKKSSNKSVKGKKGNQDDEESPTPTMPMLIKIFASILPLTTIDYRRQFVSALLPIDQIDNSDSDDDNSTNSSVSNLELILSSHYLYKTLLPHLPPQCFNIIAKMLLSSSPSNRQYLESYLIHFTQVHLSVLVGYSRDENDKNLLAKLFTSFFSYKDDTTSSNDSSILEFFTTVDNTLNQSRTNLIITILSIFTAQSSNDNATTSSIYVSLIDLLTKYVNTIPTPAVLADMPSTYPLAPSQADVVTKSSKSSSKSSTKGTKTQTTVSESQIQYRRLIPAPVASLLSLLMNCVDANTQSHKALVKILDIVKPHLLESIVLYHALSPHPTCGTAAVNSRDTLTSLLFVIEQNSIEELQFVHHLSLITVSESAHNHILNKVLLQDSSVEEFFSSSTVLVDQQKDSQSNGQESDDDTHEDSTDTVLIAIDWKKCYPSHFFTLFTTQQWSLLISQLVSELANVPVAPIDNNDEEDSDNDMTDSNSDSDQSDVVNQSTPSDRFHPKFMQRSDISVEKTAKHLQLLMFFSTLYLQSLTSISTLLSIDQTLPSFQPGQYRSAITSTTQTSQFLLYNMFSNSIDINMNLNGALFHYGLFAPLSTIFKLHIYNHIIFITTCPHVTSIVKTKSTTVTNDMVEKYAQRQVEATISTCNKFTLFILKYGLHLPQLDQLKALAANDDNKNNSSIKGYQQFNGVTQSKLLQIFVLFIMIRNIITLPWKQSQFFEQIPSTLVLNNKTKKTIFTPLLELLPSSQTMVDLFKPVEYTIIPSLKPAMVRNTNMNDSGDDDDEDDDASDNENGNLFLDDRYIYQSLTNSPSLPFLLVPTLLNSKRSSSTNSSKNMNPLVSTINDIHAPHPFSFPTMNSVLRMGGSGEKITFGPRSGQEQSELAQSQTKLLTLQLLYILLTPTQTGHYQSKSRSSSQKQQQQQQKQSSFKLIRPQRITNLTLEKFTPLVRILFATYQGTVLLDDLYIKSILNIIQNLCSTTLSMPHLPLLATCQPTNVMWVSGKNCHILPLLAPAPNSPQIAQILAQVDQVVPTQENPDQSILATPLHTRLMIVPHMFPVIFTSYSITLGPRAQQQLIKRLVLVQQLSDLSTMESKLVSKLNKISSKLFSKTVSTTLTPIQLQSLQKIRDELNIDHGQVQKEISSIEFQIELLNTEESQDRTLPAFKERLLASHARRIRRAQITLRRAAAKKKQEKEKKAALKALHHQELDDYYQALERQRADDDYYGDSSAASNRNTKKLANPKMIVKNFVGGFKTRYELIYGPYKEEDTDDDDDDADDTVAKNILDTGDVDDPGSDFDSDSEREEGTATTGATTIAANIRFDMPEGEWHTLISSLYIPLPFKHLTGQFSPLVLALGPSPSFLLDHTTPLHDLFRTNPALATTVAPPQSRVGIFRVFQGHGTRLLAQSQSSTSSSQQFAVQQYASTNHLVAAYSRYDPGLILPILSTILYLTQFSIPDLLGSQFITYIYKSLSISINSQLRAISYSLLSQIYTMSITLDLRWQRDKFNDKSIKEIELLQKKIQTIEQQSLHDRNLMLPEEIEELEYYNERLAQLKDEQRQRQRTRSMKAKEDRRNQTTGISQETDPIQASQYLIKQGDITTQYSLLDIGLALNVEKYSRVDNLPSQQFEGMNILSLILSTLRSSLLSISRSTQIKSVHSHSTSVNDVDADSEENDAESELDDRFDAKTQQALTIAQYQSLTTPTLALSSLHSHFISLLTTLTTERHLDLFSTKSRANDSQIKEQQQQFQHLYHLPHALIKLQPMMVNYLLKSHYFSFKSLPMYISANHYYNLLLSPPASGYSLTLQHKQFLFFILLTSQVHTRFDFKYLTKANIWTTLYIMYTQPNLNNYNLVQSLLAGKNNESELTLVAQQRQQFKIKLATCNWIQQHILTFLTTLIMGRTCTCHNCQQPLYYLLQQQNLIGFVQTALQYHVNNINDSIREVESGSTFLLGNSSQIGSAALGSISPVSSSLTPSLRTIVNSVSYEKSEVEFHITLNKDYISTHTRAIIAWMKLSSYIFEIISHYDSYKNCREQQRNSSKDDDDSDDDDSDDYDDDDEDDEDSDSDDERPKRKLDLDENNEEDSPFSLPKKQRFNQETNQFEDITNDDDQDNIKHDKTDKNHSTSTSVPAQIQKTIQSTFALLFPTFTQLFTSLFPQVLINSSSPSPTIITSPYIPAPLQKLLNSTLFQLLAKFTQFTTIINPSQSTPQTSILNKSITEQTLIPPDLLFVLVQVALYPLNNTQLTINFANTINIATILSNYPTNILTIGQYAYINDYKTNTGDDNIQSRHIIRTILSVLVSIHTKLLSSSPNTIPSQQGQILNKTNLSTQFTLLNALEQTLQMFITILTTANRQYHINTRESAPLNNTLRAIFNFAVNNPNIVQISILSLLTRALALIN